MQDSSSLNYDVYSFHPAKLRTESEFKWQMGALSQLSSSPQPANQKLQKSSTEDKYHNSPILDYCKDNSDLRGEHDKAWRETEVAEGGGRGRIGSEGSKAFSLWLKRLLNPPLIHVSSGGRQSGNTPLCRTAQQDSCG